MYLLSRVNCQLSAAVRIDTIVRGTQSDRSAEYGSRVNEMIATATVKLGLDPKEHTLQLVALTKDAEHIAVSDEFVWRPVTLRAYCQNDHDNPYAQDDNIFLQAIWFEDAIATVIDGVWPWR